MMGRRFLLGTLLLAVIGLTLAIAPQVWAPEPPEPSPGDIGTKECRDVQIVAQDVVESGMFRNHGQRVRAAANVVSPFVRPRKAITEECSSCIINQIARRVPLDEQELCGPDRVCGDGEIDPGEDCDDGNTDSCDGCSADCLEEFCGDEVVCPPEDCDPPGSLCFDGIEFNSELSECSLDCICEELSCDDSAPACGGSCLIDGEICFTFYDPIGFESCACRGPE